MPTEWGANKPPNGTTLRTDDLYPWALDDLVCSIPMYEGSGALAYDAAKRTNFNVRPPAEWDLDRNIVVASDTTDGINAIGRSLVDDSWCTWSGQLTYLFRVYITDDFPADRSVGFVWNGAAEALYKPANETYTVFEQSVRYDIPWTDWAGQWVDVVVVLDAVQHLSWIQVNDTVYQGTWLADYVSFADVESIYLSPDSILSHVDRGLQAKWEYFHFYNRVLDSVEIAAVLAQPFLMYEPRADTDPTAQKIVGLVRETAWSDTPTTGADPDKFIEGILFFPCKREAIDYELNVEQGKGMAGRRQESRIRRGGGVARGVLNFLPGPETMGHLLAMLLGTPETTELAASSGTDEGAYQHVWYPGQVEKSQWPVSYSIESQYPVFRSKLIQAATISKLPLFLTNDGPMVCTPEFLAKRVIWLYKDSDNEHGSGTLDEDGRERPAAMTPSPVWIDESPWGFTEIDAYPQVDGLDELGIRTLYLEPGFENLQGLLFGGGGKEIASFRADNFRLRGRATILFQDEDWWTRFRRNLAFSFSIQLTGDVIQGSHHNTLLIEVFSCKQDNNQPANRAGELGYSMGWVGLTDPELGYSCRFTLVNTTASYA